jgi:hypothetical protein
MQMTTFYHIYKAIMYRGRFREGREGGNLFFIYNCSKYVTFFVKGVGP